MQEHTNEFYFCMYFERDDTPLFFIRPLLGSNLSLKGNQGYMRSEM